MDELSTSGHSYFGLVSSAQEAHAILEASKLGLLPRVTRRLTDEERLRFVRAGAVFVWEEEEAGIRRWTDHIKWSPSRVSGAFLTYTEIPARGQETLIKQSFSSVDPNGTKMHLIAYTNKMTLSDGTLPTAARDPLIQGMLARRSSAGRDPRHQPAASTQSGSSQTSTGKRRQYRGSHPALPPIFPPVAPSTPNHLPSTSAPSSAHPSHSKPSLASLIQHDHQNPRPQSSSLDGRDHRPRSACDTYDDRPRTSTSDPRPNSSYGNRTADAPGSFGPFRGMSYPSAASESPFGRSPRFSAHDRSPDPWFTPRDPPSTSSSASSSFPYDRPSPQTNPHPRLPPISISNLQSSHPSHTPPPSFAPEPSSVPTASPFDPFPRQLPPIDDFATDGAARSRDSPPRSGLALDDEGQFRPPEPGFSRSFRGLEDERQLSLLGRGP
ncbi:hypothetical protein JCM10212_003056 [Sporobolomyces blumeae]